MDLWVLGVKMTNQQGPAGKGCVRLLCSPGRVWAGRDSALIWICSYPTAVVVEKKPAHRCKVYRFIMASLTGMICSLYVLNLKLSYYAHYHLSFFYFETPELALHNSQFENILINLILALHAATQFNLCLKQAVFSGPPHLKSPLSSAWPTFACWLAAPSACEHCFDPLPLCSTAYDHFRNSAWTIAIWSTEFD